MSGGATNVPRARGKKNVVEKPMTPIAKNANDIYKKNLLRFAALVATVDHPGTFYCGLTLELSGALLFARPLGRVVRLQRHGVWETLQHPKT
jgi:hypothetical protein